LMVGSISSANLEEDIISTVELPSAPVPAKQMGIPPNLLDPIIRAANPHIKYWDSSTHGYAVLTITPTLLTCEFKAVSTVQETTATLVPLKTFTGLAERRPACPGLPWVPKGWLKIAQHAMLGVWSFYIFRSCELVGGRHFCHTWSTNRLSCASPGLLVRGSGFSNPRKRSGIEIRALALVARRPIPFPEPLMTTQTAPVSRSSPL
jgi:hypothetical protein